MSYLVTARKWRPQIFDEVVGQEHITTTLKNAISNERIAHAYIFAGPRGVGKTTTARIFAKRLNVILRTSWIKPTGGRKYWRYNFLIKFYYIYKNKFHSIYYPLFSQSNIHIRA